MSAVVKINSSAVKNDVESEQYELVPPEGGWGYLICIGLSLIFVAGTAQQPVFGLIYKDFLNDLGEGTGAVTVVYGVFQVTIAITGFSANIALKRFSLRQVALIGALIFTLGSFIAIFVVSTTQLIIANGFLQGMGMGLLIPISYTIFNSYFTKKKVLNLSLCKATIGLSTMVYPLFVKTAMAEYGFRGTLAILCGISAHSIFGAIVYQPVRWHMVKQPKPVEKIVLIPPTPANVDSKEAFDFANDSRDRRTDNARSVENLCSGDSTQNGKGSALLLAPKLAETRRQSTPVVLIPLEKGDHKINSTSTDYMENLYKAASVSSLGNFGNIAAEPMPITKKNEGKWQTIVDFLGLDLLNDWVYNSIVLGMSMAFFADLTFFTLESLYLAKLDLTSTEIANIIAVGGATDMCARLLLGLSGQFYMINSRHMFYVGALLAAILRIVFIFFTTYIPLLILTAILGALRSLVHIAQPIVIAEHVPIERYPSAYGLYMLFIGVIGLTVGPMIGFIRDYTGSYTIGFNMLTACNLCCVIPWTIEGLWVYFNRKKVKALKT